MVWIYPTIKYPLRSLAFCQFYLRLIVLLIFQQPLLQPNGHRAASRAPSGIFSISNNRNCPGSATQKCTSFLSKDKFLQRYAITLAITVFVCYTPFYNYQLMSTISDIFFNGQGLLKSIHFRPFLPYFASVAFFLLNLNAVVNPIIFILLKHRSKKWVSLANTWANHCLLLFRPFIKTTVSS